MIGAPVRMVDQATRFAASRPAMAAALLDVLDSGRWVGGPVVAEVEQQAAELFGSQHAIGVASGTDALMLALQAAGVQPGDTVGIPALSFFATAGAVCAIGARPRLFDVDERGCLDPSTFDATDLAAVVPVHLFGNPCALSASVPIVDDAAQAAGASTPRGRLSAVSTYPTKLWSGLGDGGFVLTDDPALATAVRLLGSHGMVEPHLHHAPLGTVGRNSRLSAASAAVLLAQLPTLPDRIRRRQAIAAIYDDQLHRFNPLGRSADNPVPVYNLQVPNRDALREHLTSRGIETSVYYPRGLHHQPALAKVLDGRHFPVAERLASELVALPIHAGLTDEQVQRVLHALAAW